MTIKTITRAEAGNTKAYNKYYLRKNSNLERLGQFVQTVQSKLFGQDRLFSNFMADLAGAVCIFLILFIGLFFVGVYQ